MSIEVSIIIVNYNTLNMTYQCINSIIDKTQEISYEIILVDNGSNDGSKEFFEKDGRITYIYSEENLGFGRANNLGAQFANGNKILLLNPDTLLLNNAIKILSEYLDNHNETGAVGGNLYDIELKPCLSFKRYLPGLFWEINNITFTLLERLVYSGAHIFNKTDRVKEVGYITGADLMMRRILFEELCGFDPEFFLYYEETDLCYRIKKKKLKIKNIPTAHIQHLEGVSFKGDRINQNRIRQTELGRHTYYRKHFNRFKCYLLNGLYSFNLIMKSIIHPNSYRRQYSKAQRIQFKAIWSKK